MVSAIFVVVPFVLARHNPAFRSMQGIAIYFMEIINLLVVFWLFYFMSEIDLIGQGKIGRALTVIISGLIIYSIRSTFICLGNLEIIYFTGIGTWLDQPIVVSVFRTIVLILLTIGIIDLAKLYKE